MPISKLDSEADWIPEQAGANPVQISKGTQKAYFKPTGSGHGAYPHGMLDFVGFLVGQVTGVPVAECRAAQLPDGTRGFASLWPLPPFFIWGALPPELSATNTLEKFGGPKAFADLLVFDVWLGNKNRHAQNLLFRELNSEPWQLVLIDHGHIFANGAWANSWTDLQAPVSEPNLAIPPFIRSDNTKLAQLFDILLAKETALLNHVSTKVASINDQSVREAVIPIPNDFATEEQLEATAEILVRRKHKLLEIFPG